MPFSSFNVSDFFNAAFNNSYGKKSSDYSSNYSNYGSKKNKSGSYSYRKSGRYSGITNSVINSAMHGGGLYEAYDVTPATLAVRSAGANRANDLTNKRNYDKGFYEYMAEIGFGDRKYILSKPAQTAIARAAASERARDGFKKPYGYYVKKHQGFI